MIVEVSSSIFFIANLTHQQYLWALDTDMFLKLSSGHILKLVSIADIATKLWAIKLGVSLKFTKSLPDNFIVPLK